MQLDSFGLKIWARPQEDWRNWAVLASGPLTAMAWANPLLRPRAQLSRLRSPMVFCFFGFPGSFFFASSLVWLVFYGFSFSKQFHIWINSNLNNFSNFNNFRVWIILSLNNFWVWNFSSLNNFRNSTKSNLNFFRKFESCSNLKIV
jgi:hypothetical protein